jgi:prepilin-type processing-associated H-X9-DG protein
MLPKSMVFLNVNDPREMFPALISSLPFLVQSMNAAIQQASRGNPNQAPRVPIEVDPAKIPDPADLTRLLFPGSFTLSADSEGFRVVTRDAFPSVTSPAMTGVAVALLLPAVQSAREAARRAQCTNNMKQIALAMHNYHSVNNSLPKVAITDKDGKPLLSWRVAILPYIEQQALYNKFKLDEPWDSPHNKPLLDEMPPTYACPSMAKKDATGTSYRAFVGNNALFEKDRAVGFQDVTDGTSNTIMVVETRDTVPWSKPDDIPFDPQNKAPGFGAGSFHPGGFNACFADGSVRFIKLSVAANVLRALITRSGGEVIGAGDF